MLQATDTHTESTSVPHVASVLDEGAVLLVPRLAGISKGDLTSNVPVLQIADAQRCILATEITQTYQQFL
jgi:hypothetical protein